MLTLSPDPSLSDQLAYYTNATWGSDLCNRTSQSGTICFWKGSLISWSSKKQNNIAMSSTESEMNALSNGVQESQWLCHLIGELWKLLPIPPVFSIDSKGLLDKIKKFGSNAKTKHLDIKIKFVREKFNARAINVRLVSSSNMIADSLSKASNYNSLSRLLKACLLQSS